MNQTASARCRISGAVNGSRCELVIDERLHPHPSAGGIAMYLKMAYGKGTITAGYSLLMYFSMVINESLVARTFGTYTLQLFDVDNDSWLVPVLAVSLLIVAFIVNSLGNEFIGGMSLVTAFVKIGGIAVFSD